MAIRVTDLLILEGVYFCSHQVVRLLTHYHQPDPPARSTGPVQFHHILSGIFVLYPVILQMYKFRVSFFQLISYFAVTSWEVENYRKLICVRHVEK